MCNHAQKKKEMKRASKVPSPGTLAGDLLCVLRDLQSLNNNDVKKVGAALYLKKLDNADSAAMRLALRLVMDELVRRELL